MAQKRPGPVPVRLNAKQREALRDGRMPGESQQGALLRMGPEIIGLGSARNAIVGAGLGRNEILSRLARIESDAEAAIPVGWEIPEELHPDLSDLALDLVGIPPEQYDHETGAGFVREWYGDQWYRVVRGEITVDQFVAIVMGNAAAPPPNPSRG